MALSINNRAVVYHGIEHNGALSGGLPVIIYLAEFLHTGAGGRTPNTVPLAVAYIASYTMKVFPEAEITLFRNPDEFMASVRKRRPNVVGFSAQLWSENLARTYAAKIKKHDPTIITVVGGSSIEDITVEIERYLEANPAFDVVIPNEGEIPFASLIRHIKEYGRIPCDAPIEGCCTRGSDGKMLRGSYALPDPKEIPSPYLGGFLDRFLAEGFEPIVQTMRGCPYSCSFCVSGSPLWSKLRAFDLERIFAEIQYIHPRTSSSYLILTDENFGVLKERDVQVARFIADHSKKTGFPGHLYYYSAKIVTPSVLEIVNVLNGLGMFGISFQTLDENVRKEIRRVNVKYAKFEEYINWAKSSGIPTSTELIFGFPGETVAGYIDGLERLIVSGVDQINSYNLRLFNGIDLATQGSRAKYQYKTKFRLPERNFGIYEGDTIAEFEEIVTGSHSFDYNDYLMVRRYGFFLEVCSGCSYFTQFMRLMIKLGLRGEKLIAYLSGYDYARFSELGLIVAQYMIAARRELFENTEALQEYLQRMLDAGQEPPEVKLNFIYTGKIIFQSTICKQFFAVVKQFVESQTSDEKLRNLLFDYLDNILLPRIVTFSSGEPDVVEAYSGIDLSRLENDRFNSAADLLLPRPDRLIFELHPEIRRFKAKMPACEADSDAVIQDIFMKNLPLRLMRSRVV